MALLQKRSRTEDDAVKKLIEQINGIDDDANRVGRYVFAIFFCVFTIAATLLAIVVLSPQRE